MLRFASYPLAFGFSRRVSFYKFGDRCNPKEEIKILFVKIPEFYRLFISVLISYPVWLKATAFMASDSRLLIHFSPGSMVFSSCRKAIFHLICIGNRMNASAFRDILARVMFFWSSQNFTSRRQAQFEHFKNITSDHISRNARDHTIFCL